MVNLYDSGITSDALINELIDEIDVADYVPENSYLFFLNSAEQLLYSEIIREQSKAYVAYENIGEITEIEDMTNPNKKKLTVNVHEIAVPEAENYIRFDDITSVYADENQLIKTFRGSENIFPNTYYREGGMLVCETDFTPSGIKVIYNIRPRLKTAENNDTVKLPYEFVDLIKAKIRGEIYKLVNEDELAAKWLNDYNSNIEGFKYWVESRRPNFGM